MRVAAIAQISPKAYKISSFDGSEDIIPSSCVFGRDYEVAKSDAYWIASWILEKKKIQYSTKVAWFNKETGNKLPTYKVEKHIPEERDAVECNTINELRKC